MAIRSERPPPRRVSGANPRRGAGASRAAVLFLLAVSGFLGCTGWPDSWWFGSDPSVESEEARFPPGPLVLGVSLPNADAGEAARMLSHAGVRAANASCDLSRWRESEDSSNPARDPAWAPMDAWVHDVQAAGFRDLSLCLDFEGAPASDVPETAKSAVPSPRQLASFAAWVGRVVERYDADGGDDMDGLVAPVQRFRIGSHLDPGGVEPFAAFPALVSRAHAAIRAASSDARLVLPPLRAVGDPPAASAARIEGFADTSYFDAWSLEASGSPGELDAWLAWLAQRTPDVPVEILGGATRPLAEGVAQHCDARAARTYLDARTAAADRCALDRMFVDLLARDVGTTAWVRGHVARDLAQKAIVASSHGVTRAELGIAHDATGWTAATLETDGGLAPWSGWLDADSGGAYPAYYAGRQLDTLFRGRGAASRRPTSEPGVSLFLLDGAAGPAWVGWYDPPGFVRPGYPPPVKTVTIPIGVDAVWLEQVITDTGTIEPLVSDGLGAEGRLRLDLTPTPLFVTPLEETPATEPDAGE